MMALQYFSGALSETPAADAASNADETVRGNGLSIAGEAIVNGLAGPDGAHAVKIRFVDTDFQGLLMEVETDMDQNMTMWLEDNTTVPVYVPFQKLTGAIDCVNQQLEEDIVIVSGIVQGTANEPVVDYRAFKEGDRFMTAVRANHANVDADMDQVAEIVNFGLQDVPDLSDCLYAMGSDFELREVVGGHITVY